MKIAIMVLSCLLVGAVGAYAEQRALMAESLAAMNNNKVRVLMSTFKKDDAGYMVVNSAAGNMVTVSSEHISFNDEAGDLKLSISGDRIVFYRDGKAVKVISAE